MATLRAIPRSSFVLVLAAFMLSMSILVNTFYNVQGTNHDTTFYACLYAGSLSQVNTAGPPANCGRGSQVQWNAQGIQGLPGEPGSPGVSGLTTGTRTLHDTVFVPGNEVLFTVPCRDGLVPLGSGYDLDLFDSGVTIVSDYASAGDLFNPFGFRHNDQLRPGEYGWTMILRPTISGIGEGELYVYCAYVTPPVLP